jgi:glucose/arabinose dehydrogenase
MILYKVNTMLKLLMLITVIPHAYGQPGTAKLTPEHKARLVSQKIVVPDKYKKNMSREYFVNIPEGYKATIFYTGELSKSRFMCWGPDSTLYVANMSSGEVLALPDKDHNNVADTAIVVARNAYGHDLEFYGKDMYVAEELKVKKFSDKDGDGIFETSTVFIDNILGGKLRPPGGHTTRTIVFDKARKKIYLSVGSSCNICREEGRALIYEYDLDGKNKKVFASGTRNCVGMTIHPRTGELWATNNGSDNLGNEIPPEWIDVIKEDGFYGYPFAYGNQVYFDFKADDDYKKILPLKKSDSALVKKMEQPAALIQAHSAPMAIQFPNKSFKKEFKDGAFVAYRGSWDRHPPTGYKVVYLHFKKDQVTGVSDFITGFLPSDGSEPWARPVGLEADLRGNLYMSSDDINQFILVLSPIQK